MNDIEASMRQLIDHVVDHVPGVVGVLVSSADGFVLSSRLPSSGTADGASVAAMSAALLGLSSRLTQTVAPGPARLAEVHAVEGHAFVFAIASAATLTLLAGPDTDRQQVIAVGRELTLGIGRLLRGTADV